MSTGDELAGRGARSRDAILDAATGLMAERGYAGTSISAICAASGLPPSSVYWHFGSKEGLLAAILDRASASHLGEFDATDISGATRDNRLEKLLLGVGRLAAGETANVRFLLTIGMHEARAREQTTTVLRQARRRILTWLSEGLADIFELDDPRLAHEMATLIAAVANGTQVAEWIEDSDEVTLPVAHLKTALTAIADTHGNGRRAQ